MGKESATFDLGGAAADAAAGVGAAPDQGGMVFDLVGVEEEKKFEIMPKGTYNAVVEDLSFGDSSKGNPMITIVYEVTDPEFEKRKLYDYWVLQGNGSEFGLAKTKKFLTRVCPEIDLSTFSPQTFADSGVAVGRQVQVKVKIQTQKQGEYKGEKRNQVEDVLAGNGGFML